MKKISILILVLATLAACDSPKEKAIKHIASLEANDSIFSPEAFNERKQSYLDFASKYPDDEQAPVYKFKAAQLCNTLADHMEGIRILNELIDTYPTHPLAENALFLQGYIYENSIGNLEAAEKVYRQFIEKYPNSEMLEDAQLSLQNLGKSPEQIWDEMNK